MKALLKSLVAMQTIIEHEIPEFGELLMQFIRDKSHNSVSHLRDILQRILVFISAFWLSLLNDLPSNSNKSTQPLPQVLSLFMFFDENL